MAKVCGPVMVESLGLGGACPAVPDEAAMNKNKVSVIGDNLRIITAN